MTESKVLEPASNTAEKNFGQQSKAADKMKQIYEEMFATRYTDQDEEFKQYCSKPLADPPCVENWYSRPKRTYDWSRGQSDRGHRGRGQNYFNQGQHRGQGNWNQDRQGYRGPRNDQWQHRNDQQGRGRWNAHQAHGSGRTMYAGMRGPGGQRDDRPHHQQSRHHPYGRAQGHQPYYHGGAR